MARRERELVRVKLGAIEFDQWFHDIDLGLWMLTLKRVPVEIGERCLELAKSVKADPFLIALQSDTMTYRLESQRAWFGVVCYNARENFYEITIDL